jgi:2-polyprenyl-3-methyl-5-hydroxy-6-metoxy-1,4-benzoquinol methylase
MPSQLRTKLFESYAAHYRRVNQRVDRCSPHSHEAFIAMYRRYLAPLPPGSPVLDAGCGTGLLLQHLRAFSQIKAVGVDISLGQIETARECLPEADLHCADALEYLKAQPQRFAGIFCMDVMEHMETKDDCFEFAKALLGALRPGGFCIVKTPNGANLTAGLSRYMDLTHERCFTRTSLLQLMEAAGFQHAEVIPVAATHFSGKMRLLLEKAMHRAVFRICGSGTESVFTIDIIVSGRAPQ